MLYWTSLMFYFRISSALESENRSFLDWTFKVLQGYGYNPTIYHGMVTNGLALSS